MPQKTKTIAVPLILLILLLSAALAPGHEAHQQTQSAPDKTQQPASEEPTRHEEPQGQETSSEPVKPAPMPFSTPIMDHLHNKIVHFPIAFGVAGSIFLLISLRKPEMLNAARILWFLAAAIAVGAYFSGKLQEEPFEHGVMHDVFEAHENSAIATAIALGLGFLLTLTRRFPALKIIWAILVLFLVSVAGYYGGLLAHS